MSWFEWIGEQHNPGRVGSVDVVGGYRSQQPWPLVGFRLLFSAAAIAGVFYLVLQYFPATREVIGITLAATMAYIVTGYLIRPQADMSNLGMMGGMIDHPFRYTDDLNRSLLFFQAVLFPGKFIGESFADAMTLVLNAPSSTPAETAEDDEFTAAPESDAADPFAAYYQDGSANPQAGSRRTREANRDRYGDAEPFGDTDHNDGYGNDDYETSGHSGQSSAVMVLIFVGVAVLVFAGILAALLLVA